MRRIGAAAALLAAVGVSAAPGAPAAAAERPAPAGATAHGQHGGEVSPAASAFQRDSDAAMARMMGDMHSPGYSGNVDIDFLSMMIPHHQGAVDMARLVLQHGRDPATRRLAEDIIASQTIEIESMTRRLAMLRADENGRARGLPDFPSLGGTRGP